MSGSLWGVGCCPWVDAMTLEDGSPGSGDVEGWGQSTFGNPHWPPGTLQGEVSLSAVTATPKLPEPHVGEASWAGD